MSSERRRCKLTGDGLSDVKVRILNADLVQAEARNLAVARRPEPEVHRRRRQRRAEARDGLDGARDAEDEEWTGE